jgi:hypothetical protein
LQQSIESFLSVEMIHRKDKSGSPVAGMQRALLNESFQFVVNRAVIESDIAEAAALFFFFFFFSSSESSFQSYGCARNFFFHK